MKQTPIHENFNPDLLEIMPDNLAKIVEAGCSSGALAQAYKEKNSACHYVGIEVDPEYAAQSQRYCDRVLTANIDQLDDAVLGELSNIDCWVFGDVLEHLVDPWAVLTKVKKTLSEDGCIVACIPNMQHWSIQVKLLLGTLRYESTGLLDRTHLRWFTRVTIVELFESAGLQIVDGWPRAANVESEGKMLEVVKAAAVALGADPKQAVDDAIPFQYVVKAIPI
jgi:2-polyprenyl-3-methyl-5-hydroxy-6-metoxy-1,4-benzoquinol methylase